MTFTRLSICSCGTALTTIRTMAWWFPKVESIGSVNQILDGMETAISVSSGRAIGFVLDADSPLDSRWQAVQHRIEQLGIQTPAIPPSNGFIAESERFKARVGVWLMPDNQNDGKLEHFLQSLIADNDQLINHARASTNSARDIHGASFSDGDSIKAEIHTWLAWQQERRKRTKKGTQLFSRALSR